MESEACETFVDPATGKVWRKVLYERGKFPDNYTPDSCFLAAIKRNKNLQPYTLNQCLHGGAQVALQMCMVLLFVITYITLDGGCANCELILGLAAFMCLSGYVGLQIFDSTIKGPFSAQKLKSDFRLTVIFLCYGLGLSPVLYKLTDTISTDTIYTTAGIMLFVHLVFHNYGLEKSAVVSKALSLNASLFASVCLASRLMSSYEAFVLLAISVVAFVLFPIFRLKLNGIVLFVITVMTVIFSVILTGYYCSLKVSLFAAIAIGIVTGVCPALFLHWQTYKHTIHGPWDEAVPNIVQ